MRKALFILICIILFVLTLTYSGIPKAIAVLIIIYCITKGRKEKRWYNPYYLSLTLPISFLCYSSVISPLFTPPLKISTQFFIIGCICFLLLGYDTIKHTRIRPCITNQSNHNFWIIFIIGALPTFIGITLYGNTLNMEGDQLLDAKENMSIPLLGQLSFFLQASIIVACKKNNSKLILISLTASIFAALITVTKTAIVITFIFTLIGMTQFKPQITRTKLFSFIKKYALLIVPIILIGLFIFNNNSRQADGADSEYAFLGSIPSIVPTVKDNNFTRNMYLNYCYFCTPWTNLEENLTTTNYYSTNGNYTFAQFYKKIGIKTFLPERKTLNSAFNTYSFISDYYLDFGHIGTLIASFILGCLIFFFYQKFGYSNDPLLIAFYSLIAYATAMLFFSNHFNAGYILNYFLTFGGYTLITQFNTKKYA